MVDPPIAERGGLLGLKIVLDRIDVLKGSEQIELFPPQRPFDTPQAVEGLRSQLLRKDNLPPQATGENLRPWQQLVHNPPPPCLEALI